MSANAAVHQSRHVPAQQGRAWGSLPDLISATGANHMNR